MLTPQVGFVGHVGVKNFMFSMSPALKFCDNPVAVYVVNAAALVVLIVEDRVKFVVPFTDIVIVSADPKMLQP